MSLYGHEGSAIKEVDYWALDVSQYIFNNCNIESRAKKNKY